VLWRACCGTAQAAEAQIGRAGDDACRPEFFVLTIFVTKKITFRPMNDLIPDFDPKLGVVAYSVETTQLGVISYGVEL
jgi:hypothetical protein